MFLSQLFFQLYNSTSHQYETYNTSSINANKSVSNFKWPQNRGLFDFRNFYLANFMFDFSLNNAFMLVVSVLNCKNSIEQKILIAHKI